MEMLVIDARRAHFYARAPGDVFIELLAEDPRAGEPGACGKLLKTMYGTRDAAERWADLYTTVLIQHGLIAKTSPCRANPSYNDELHCRGCARLRGSLRKRPGCALA